MWSHYGAPRYQNVSLSPGGIFYHCQRNIPCINTHGSHVASGGWEGNPHCNRDGDGGQRSVTIHVQVSSCGLSCGLLKALCYPKAKIMVSQQLNLKLKTEVQENLQITLANLFDLWVMFKYENRVGKCITTRICCKMTENSLFKSYFITPPSSPNFFLPP